MLDTPCSEFRQFPLHFPSHTSPCAITFQLESNAGYTMLRGSVKGTGCPLHSPVSPSLPLPCVTVCHHISSGVYHHPQALPVILTRHFTLPDNAHPCDLALLAQVALHTELWTSLTLPHSLGHASYDYNEIYFLNKALHDCKFVHDTSHGNRGGSVVSATAHSSLHGYSSDRSVHMNNF